MESDVIEPTLIFSDFSCQTYGLDIIDKDGELYAIFGSFDGFVSNVKLSSLESVDKQHIHQNKEPRSNFIEAIDNENYYSSTHRRELKLFKDGECIELLNRDKKFKTMGMLLF